MSGKPKRRTTRPSPTRDDGSSRPLDENRLLPPHYGRPATPLAMARNASSSGRLPSLFRTSSSADVTPTATDTEEAAAVNDVVDRATLAQTAVTHSPYGFTLYLLTGVGYILYLVWAYTPDAYLRKMGVQWYPQREWAILIPAWVCMLVVYIYVAFALYAVSFAPPPDSLSTLSDHYARIANVQGNPSIVVNSHAVLDDEALPAIQDLPVGLANRVMFGDMRSPRSK